MKEPEETITLIDEEGVERDFTLVDIIEVDGCEYAIILPVNDEEEDEAVVLRFAQDEEGNDLLIDIEDDEEWEKVVDTWEEMISR
jgi:uncharacterized protein YrzB (UPF0473 family)